MKRAMRMLLSIAFISGALVMGGCSKSSGGGGGEPPVDNSQKLIKEINTKCGNASCI